MTDDVVRLPVIGQIIRRRWRSLAVFAAVGALLGALASLLFSPGYETSSTVLLQGPRSGDELVTEAQIAMSTVVLDRTAAALGWEDVTGPDLRDSVQAEVAEGSLITITGAADTPELAQQLTERATEEYVTFSTQLISNPSDASAQVLQERQEALRQMVTETSKKINDLHKQASRGALTVDGVQARTKLEALRNSLTDAIIRLDEAETASSRVGMVIMGKSELPSSAAAPSLIQLVGGGILLSVLAGLFTFLFAARKDRRPTNPADIAAALGVPVLASVDVLDFDRAPDGDGVHYRRALARLRAELDDPLRLVVVVPDDDANAHGAVKQLALAVGLDGGHYTELRVAEVSAERPSVPADADASGAVVVLTAGTRDPWELIGISVACADAGHRVLGAIVAHPAERDGAAPHEGPAGVAGQAMAGSA